MKISRIRYENGIRIAVEKENNFFILPTEVNMGLILSQKNPLSWILALPHKRITRLEAEATCLPPVEDQEIWACGLTYPSSRKARMDETHETTADCYDRIYTSKRPQVFPKARGRNAVSSGHSLELRLDSKWIVPEPELVLVINQYGEVVGTTVGNDMSCRDIEGENPLYQPQAKIWRTSCVLHPTIELCLNAKSFKDRQIEMWIVRNNVEVFRGKANTAAMVRNFETLTESLFEQRSFPDGVFLFTGTSIVPPNAFTLLPNDKVHIWMQGIGELMNEAVTPSYELKEPFSKAS